MNILVINAGSSSIKYQLIDMTTENPLSGGLVERIGLDKGKITHHTFIDGHKTTTVETLPIPNHTIGMKRIVTLLTDKKKGVIANPAAIKAIGHRLVHGGEFFSKTTIITPAVKAKVKELFPLAPLHNPANLTGVEVAESIFPNAIQIGVFDTAFHQTLPEAAYRYALPRYTYTEMGIRKYGFHGSSHKYVSEKAIDYLGKKNTKIITIHLGNGASMAAVLNGKSVDTSMGLAPLGGLVMGTRSGDIDPAIIFYLAEQKKLSLEKINHLLNKKSGMKGLTGDTDMRDIKKRYTQGDQAAKLAYQLYAYRIKQYIGNYTAVMNGLDALVFTAGIGENDPLTRELVCTNMDFFGIKLDPQKNNTEEDGIREINAHDARIKILVIPTNEELEIAGQCYELLLKSNG